MVTEKKREPDSNRPASAPRILIVEESDINRHLAQHVFVQAGYTVEAVANGYDAVEAATQREFDLIIMDCRLRDFPQFMATRLIRQREAQQGIGRRVPIVGLTAFAPPGFHERCLHAGMDACFEKPFREALLHQILARWLPPAAVRSRRSQSVPVAVLTASADRPPHPGASPRGRSGTTTA